MTNKIIYWEHFLHQGFDAWGNIYRNVFINTFFQARVAHKFYFSNQLFMFLNANYSLFEWLIKRQKFKPFLGYCRIRQPKASPLLIYFSDNQLLQKMILIKPNSNQHEKKSKLITFNNKK